MSCLTYILELLQLLTTLSGCNIYKYVPRKRAFRLSSQLNFAVGVLHRFWLRPWLFVMFLLYFIFYLMEFLEALVDLRPATERSLNLLYMTVHFCVLNMNLLISYSIAYNYLYQRKQMQDVLNRFVRIFERYSRICGQEPTINWWFFFIHLIKMGIMTILPRQHDYIPFVVPTSKFSKLLRGSALLFALLQPLLLGVTAYMALLILYSFYGLKISRSNRHLIDYHKHLIKLRQKFNPFMRPFVWICLIEEFCFIVIIFHLVFYDERLAGKLIYGLTVALGYPLCLIYINVAIYSAEGEFGRFRANFKPQRRMQIFWLYRLAMQSGADKSEMNVFRLNRSHLLQILSQGWIWAMFSNSIFVNSTAFLRRYERVKQAVNDK